MNIKALIIALLLTTNVYAAGITKDNLEPDLSIFTGFRIVTDYYSNVVTFFSKAFAPSVKLRAVVLPSFVAEYVTGIRERDNKYFAFKLTAQSQLWGEYQRKRNNMNASAPKEIEVHESEVEISQKTYKLLDVVWRKMILNTKYYEDTFGRGLDGTSYHFSISNLHAAQTWSPKPNTQTGYLVKIADQLGQYAESKNRKLEKELLDTTKKLMKSLK